MEQGADALNRQMKRFRGGIAGEARPPPGAEGRPLASQVRPFRGEIRARGFEFFPCQRLTDAVASEPTEANAGHGDYACRVDSHVQSTCSDR